jgi:cation diffusion facilitator CzcD-associated flavoprotein CzcO
LTPLYDSLTTNLAHPLMAYDDTPFPPETPLYPRADVVLSYLKDYAICFDLHRFIHLNSRVLSVQRPDENSPWRVTWQSGQASTTAHTNHFDSVIIANGHYRVPRIPATPGLLSWIAEGRATHAAYFRHPLPEHRDAIVLVVGAGPSGTDIARDMRKVARVVVHSITGGAPEVPERDDYHQRPQIQKYRGDGSVLFEDGSVYNDIDSCILATGYEFVFPFLPCLKNTTPALSVYEEPLINTELMNSGYHVFPLARHVFPLVANMHPGSLAFAGHPSKVIPFPLFEAQARAIAHILLHPGSLNRELEAEAIRRRAKGKLAADDDSNSDEQEAARVLAKGWHRFDASLEQFEYRDKLDEFSRESFPTPDGAPRHCPAWARELYSEHNFEMRDAWRALEKEGLADQWVEGVGKGGMQEWVDLMWKVAKWGQDRKDKMKVEGQRQGKL